MSVNEIDVNAVNKRTLEKCPDPDCSRDTPEHVAAIKNIRNMELDMIAKSSKPIFQTGVDEAMKVVAPPLPQMPEVGSTIPIHNINRWRARYYYFVLDLFLFVESLVWTIMDFTRSRRMRWANKMKDATDRTKA